jgi:excisionase family DNA binding protein
MDRLLLRVGEAAETLGMGRSTVYELIAAGVLPAVKVGKSLRVPIEQLKAWIAEASGKQSIGSDG